MCETSLNLFSTADSPFFCLILIRQLKQSPDCVSVPEGGTEAESGSIASGDFGGDPVATRIGERCENQFGLYPDRRVLERNDQYTADVACPGETDYAAAFQAVGQHFSHRLRIEDDVVDVELDNFIHNRPRFPVLEFYI